LPARWTEIKSKILSLLAVLVAIAAAITVFAIVRSGGPFRARSPVTTSPANVPQEPRPVSGSDPAAATDPAKPAYRGPLGDFFVTGKGNEVASYPPCPQPKRPARNHKASELYSPVFGDPEVGECANGLIPAISVYGRPSMGKRYFVGLAKVNYVVPLDRLRLLIVAGHPAIAQLPAPDDPEGLELIVIQRFPSKNKPGIMVWIHRPGMSLEETVALAAKIMGVRP